MYSFKINKYSLPFFILLGIVIVSLFSPSFLLNTLPNNHIQPIQTNHTDWVWMMISTSFVFLMTPGLSFFYGGMVNRKNILSTMIKSFVAAGVVTVVWVVVAFSLAFGNSWHGIIGNPFTHFLFNNVQTNTAWELAPTIPFLLFALFQLKFAIITPALVVGAVAERIRFRSYVLFIVLFIILIYAPIAHWTWHPQGFLFKLGVLDFAGGTVVHISAGCTALIGAMMFKRHTKHNHLTHDPVNIPYVLLGTGLLWFGWFGFNAGSAFGTNNISVISIATTTLSSATAGLTWIFCDALINKKPGVLGFCIGAVVGLVAITPSCGFVSPMHALFIGFIAAVISHYAVHIKNNKLTIDDTLDVFPCHGLGGIVGMILVGVFANQAINPAISNGLFFGDNTLIIKQLQGLVVVVLYTIIMAFAIFKLVNYIETMRVSKEEEEQGLDISQHDERY